MKRIFYILTAILLISLLVLSRMFSPMANFTAVGAVALFSGFIFGTRRGIMITLSGMLFSDLVFEGLYDAGTMIAVYGSLAAAVFIGSRNLNFGIRSERINNLLSVITKAISGGVIFYLVSNLAVWLFSGMYTLTFEGLIECYALAVPFFRNMWLGDLSYSIVLFGTFYLISDFTYSGLTKKLFLIRKD